MENKLEKSFIEKRIEQKAKEQLDSDITRLLKPLRESPLIKSIRNDVRIGVKTDTGVERSLDNAIEYNQQLIGALITEKMLPIYIKQETDEFMQKLDSLKYFLDENL